METNQSSHEDRQRIRKLHKQLRAEMTEDAVREKSMKVCEKLLCSDWYGECSVIYAYYPLGNEVDCIPFLKQALLDGKILALPRMEKTDKTKGHTLPRMGNGHRMEFYRVTSLEQVEEGNFHVMEPVEACPLIAEYTAVTLVPGVVFDQNGNRYGYGKGCYDRYFVRFPRLRRMALAYENQMEEHLTVLPTDIKMERIYTEQRVYKMESGCFAPGNIE